MSTNPEQDIAEADPDEIVSITGLGNMSLRTAVRGFVEARASNLGPGGTQVYRDHGKEPPILGEEHLALLAERNDFR